VVVLVVAGQQAVAGVAPDRMDAVEVALSVRGDPKPIPEASLEHLELADHGQCLVVAGALHAQVLPGAALRDPAHERVRVRTDRGRRGTVFEAVHRELLAASARAAAGARDEVEFLIRGFEAFLDAVLERDVQQIVIADTPAVLGLARFTELDERYAFAAISEALAAAAAAGKLRADDPDTLTRLLLGALTRGAMLIASSPDPPRGVQVRPRPARGPGSGRLSP
jgi:hypothetical protein